MTEVEPGTPRAQRDTPWRAREGIPIWIMAWLVAGVVGVLTDSPGGPVCDPTCTLAAVWANELVLLGLTLLWVAKRHRASPGELGLSAVRGEDLGPGIKVAAIGLVIGYAAAEGARRLWEVVSGGDVDVPRQVDLGAEPSTAALIALGIGVVLLAPLAEEVFFRGFLYRALRRTFRAGPAIAVSAALFGGAHLIPIVVIATFVLGVLLGRLVEEQRRLMPAVVAHVVFNLFGFSVLVAQYS